MFTVKKKKKCYLKRVATFCVALKVARVWRLRSEVVRMIVFGRAPRRLEKCRGDAVSRNTTLSSHRRCHHQPFTFKPGEEGNLLSVLSGTMKEGLVNIRALTQLVL